MPDTTLPGGGGDGRTRGVGGWREGFRNLLERYGSEVLALLRPVG